MFVTITTVWSILPSNITALATAALYYSITRLECLEICLRGEELNIVLFERDAHRYSITRCEHVGVACIEFVPLMIAICLLWHV